MLDVRRIKYICQYVRLELKNYSLFVIQIARHTKSKEVS